MSSGCKWQSGKLHNKLHLNHFLQFMFSIQIYKFLVHHFDLLVYNFILLDGNNAILFVKTAETI